MLYPLSVGLYPLFKGIKKVSTINTNDIMGVIILIIIML